MKVRLSTLLLLGALISVPAYAQTGVAGKWTGELPASAGRGAVQPITVDLKLEGEVLTGTVTEGALDPRPIIAGTVEGSNVTFRTLRNLSGSDINVNWKGELKGSDLTLNREIGPAPAEAAGGRGGGGGRGGAAAGGRGGGRGGAPAGGGQRGDAAAAAPIPPVPAAPAAAGDVAAGAAAGGRGAGGRGGGGRGAAAAPAAAPLPSVTLTLHRAN